VADFEKIQTGDKQVYAKDASNFLGLNTADNAAGNYAPIQPGHSWVVGVDKASKLDPNKIFDEIHKTEQNRNQQNAAIDSDPLYVVEMFQALGIDLKKDERKDAQIEQSILDVRSTASWAFRSCGDCWRKRPRSLGAFSELRGAASCAAILPAFIDRGAPSRKLSCRPSKDFQARV